MNYYSVINLLENICKSIPNVGDVYVGDIYELNHRQDVEYPAMVITKQTSYVNPSEQNQLIRVNIFYVDRLLSDKSNVLDIQNAATEALEDVITMAEEAGVIINDQYEMVVFEERFNDICAGAYVSPSILVNLEECAGDSWTIVNAVNGRSGYVSLKTINDQSLLGAGNIEISGGSLQYYSEEGSYDLDSAAKIEVKNAYIKAEGVDGGTVTVEGSHIDLHSLNDESRIVVGDNTGIHLYTTGSNDFKYNGEDVVVASDLVEKANASALTEVNNSLTAHTANTDIHTNANEKDYWNAGIASHQNQLNDLKTNKQDVSGMTAYATTSSLSTVATTGQYSDIIGTPTFTLSGSTLIITTA